MHEKNPYKFGYDFERLTHRNMDLKQHIIYNPSGQKTINFSDAPAVLALNKSLLLSDFKLNYYHLPKGYLIPPIPGRLDYLLHIHDIISEKVKISPNTRVKGLDLGCGANGIYCILGAQYYNWKMVGIESDAKAVAVANKNISNTKELQDKIAIRYQSDKSFLLKNCITSEDEFDFLVCNPPFHTSEKDAIKGSLKKYKNLNHNSDKSNDILNFQGKANELWCNGGESLFIKRLIKESIIFKHQIKFFTSLVAKASHLPKLEKQLYKAKANYKIIPMAQGHKKSRFIIWWF